MLIFTTPIIIIIIMIMIIIIIIIIIIIYNTLLTILLTCTNIRYLRYLQSWLLVKLQYFPYIIHISFFWIHDHEGKSPIVHGLHGVMCKRRTQQAE